MTNRDKLNMNHLIYRIESESENTKDMALLLTSEITAYYHFQETCAGTIVLYPESEIKDDVAIVGELHTGDKIFGIILRQEYDKQHKLVKSVYELTH